MIYKTVGNHEVNKTTIFKSQVIEYLVLFLIPFLLQACSPKNTQDKRAMQFEQVDLFIGGENDIANYRIPSLITTTKGTLLAVVDARVDGFGPYCCWHWRSSSSYQADPSRRVPPQ